MAKTTSAYLGYLKALEGKKVLMVDLDSQASLTILCGFQPGRTEYSVCDLFNEKTDPLDCAYLIPATHLDNLYIIPSDIELAEVEQILVGKLAREQKLKKTLEAFTEYFDYVYVDCPPQLGILTTNALVAAEKVIVPTKAEYFSSPPVSDEPRYETDMS